MDKSWSSMCLSSFDWWKRFVQTVMFAVMGCRRPLMTYADSLPQDISRLVVFNSVLSQNCSVALVRQERWLLGSRNALMPECTCGIMAR